MAAFGTNKRGDLVGRYRAEGVAHRYLLLRGRITRSIRRTRPTQPPAASTISERIVGFHLASDDLFRLFRGCIRE